MNSGTAPCERGNRYGSPVGGHQALAEVQTVDFATLMSVAGTREYDILAVQYTYAPVDPYPDVAWLLGGEGSWTGLWRPRWTKLSGPPS